ncbi:methyltransferase family protein [Larkinella arboricola]|uniref:Methyltransferase family protein n=1 Tax=Larkinella arboricola TaxID=643671 RepID=A0A327WSX5_LARAB|nr:class I SAM-dependent methyltransferase [Larkinella arboricola]RAJ95728.1 methyltransferase family protein [Larkinella arboricola]
MDLKAVAAQLRKPDGDFGKQMGAKMNESNRAINFYTIQKLNLKNNARLLEIGMGNGFFVKDIVAHYPSVTYTGCDFSETMVQEAGKLNASLVEDGQVTFLLAPSNALPFPDATFDTVFTINTLYFWSDPRQELTEIRRVLKPGGRLLLAIRPKSVMEKLPFTAYDFTLYEKEDVVELLTKNGYGLMEVIEKNEPDQNVNGQFFRMETLIIEAEKL